MADGKAGAPAAKGGGMGAFGIVGIILIVVVVLTVVLFAVAVIASVVLYFWVGGLATVQPTPYSGQPVASGPIVISAQTVECDSDGMHILVQNLDPMQDVYKDDLFTVDDSGEPVYAMDYGIIGAGQQGTVEFWGEFTEGNAYIVTADAGMGQAQVVC